MDDHTAVFGMLSRANIEQEGEEDEEEEEELNEDGVLFYVNKGGFPIDHQTWERMWNHVAKIHPRGLDLGIKIRNTVDLEQVPIPQAPLNYPANTPIPDRLDMVQKYMSELQYNHTGTQFFEIKKNRPISGLMDTAKEMVRESLPIKCLESVILATFLTNGMPGVDRFPISFKSIFQGTTHRHVVLGIFHNGFYGALGMSRRQDLMHKSLKYKSLSSVVLSFKKAYNKYWHELKKVKIGLPISHDPHSYEQIQWKAVSVNAAKLSDEDLSRELDKHARDMRNQPKATPIPDGNSPKKTPGGTAAAGGKKEHRKASITRQHSESKPPSRKKSDKPKNTKPLPTDVETGNSKNSPAKKGEKITTDQDSYQIRI